MITLQSAFAKSLNCVRSFMEDGETKWHREIDLKKKDTLEAVF